MGDKRASDGFLHAMRVAVQAETGTTGVEVFDSLLADSDALAEAERDLVSLARLACTCAVITAEDDAEWKRLQARVDEIDARTAPQSPPKAKAGGNTPGENE